MGKQESEKTVTGSDGSGRYERKALIDKLYETQELSREEWIRLIEGRTPELSQYLFEKARAVREREYGKPFISEDSLNAAIIAETTVIIVESAAGIRMRSVTV